MKITEAVVLSGAVDPVLLIAGRGALPGLLSAALSGRAHLIALEGFADPLIKSQAAQSLALGQFGAMIAAGLAAGARKALFIGGLDRPSADQLSLDDYSLKNLDLSALLAGDDGALRAIAALFEGAGIEVIGPLAVAPNLAMKSGTLTQANPEMQALADLKVGEAVAGALGRLDVGQAVVVQQGLVLGVEGIEGTDALIKRCGALKRGGSPPILVKRSKPQQDMRLDVPTFGPTTVENLAEAGFAGAFLEAGRTLLVDEMALTAQANAAALFINGFGA